MGLWNIVVPETAQHTNLVLNPSIERNVNGYLKDNGTEFALEQSLSHARFGTASLYCETSTNTAIEGWIYPNTGLNGISVSPSVNYTFYLWLKSADLSVLSLLISWYTAAGAFISSSTLNLPALPFNIWSKASLTATSPSTAAFATLRVRETSGSATATYWYSDGINFIQASYDLSNIDGDQPGGRWTGLRHASTSTLDPQERSGGRERDLADFGVNVLPDIGGIGVAPLQHNFQPLALQPGVLFQSTKALPRFIDLHLDVEGSSYANLFEKRKDLINLIKPDLTRDSQAFTLAFAGAHATKKAYARFRYDGGAEFSIAGKTFAEQPMIRLVADDPFWFEDNQEVATLDFQDSVAQANRAIRRHVGQWKSLGVGFNGSIRAIVVDKQRGRIYFGGTFSTANGVAANNVCYWDGTTFVAMGSGTDTSVFALAIAPNGDVWVGGAFDTAGGVAAHGLARWNVSSSTWTQFALGAITDSFSSLAIAPDGTLYAGGVFVNWNGNANSDNIVQYDGTTWSNLGTGANGEVTAIAVHPDGNVYIGGAFTTANGVTVNRIAYWNGTTFVALSTGADSTVQTVAIDRAGGVYVGGLFTTIGGASINRIARWDGSQFFALGSGLNGTGFQIAITDSGILYVIGGFTQAGELTIAERIAGWNGSTWFHLDVDFPGSPNVRAIAIDGEDLYVGYDTGGNATASGLTTVTNNGTTAVFPIVTIVGPSSASMTVQWLENQSTQERLYFNLVVQAGETVTIDLSRGRKRVASDWRGVISDQPLANSDFGSFHLLSGANIIAAFAIGTITGATIQMRWIPQHWSADGIAA